MFRFVEKATVLNPFTFMRERAGRGGGGAQGLPDLNKEPQV